MVNCEQYLIINQLSTGQNGTIYTKSFTFGDIVVNGVDSAFVSDHAVIRASASSVDFKLANLVSVGQEHGWDISCYAVLSVGCKTRITSARKAALGVRADLRAVVEFREGTFVQINARLVVDGRYHKAFSARTVKSMG